MDESQKELARRVREARKARRYTQKQVADLAGVVVGVVSNFELFKTFPQPSNLRHILQVVGLEDEVTVAEIADLGGDSQLLDNCPTCGRTKWPEAYDVMFDILGAFMDTMDRAERKAFVLWATRPAVGPGGGSYRPWLHD